MYADDLNDLSCEDDSEIWTEARSNRAALVDVLKALGVGHELPEPLNAHQIKDFLEHRRGHLAMEIAQRLGILHSPYVGSLFHFAVFIAAYRHRLEAFRGA